MQFFVDSADVDEVRRAARLGVVSGVTTNPSLATRAGVSGMRGYREAVGEIASIVDGPISIEVVSEDVEGMITEGREYVTWAPRPWVKLPSTAAGFEAMKALSEEGIEVNQTLCFSVNQALLGAQAGAAAVSPFVGRIDDTGVRGMDLVEEIVSIYKNYGIRTQVLAASIRHPLHCVEAARAGAQIVTAPCSVLEQMVNHPLTTLGVEKFREDWQSASGG